MTRHLHKDKEDAEARHPRVSVSPRPCVSSDRSVSPSPAHPISTSDFRILLWDIDGTLIRSIRTGAFKDYTIPVLEDVFGTAGRLPEMKVSGMTDLQIVGEALRLEGFTHGRDAEGHRKW